MVNQNNFYKADPIEDGVLVCTKKQKNIESFKYVPLENVKLKDGTKLGTFINDLLTTIEKLKGRVEKLEETLELSVDYQLAQAAEGAANEKDSIN